MKLMYNIVCIHLYSMCMCGGHTLYETFNSNSMYWEKMATRTFQDRRECPVSSMGYF